MKFSSLVVLKVVNKPTSSAAIDEIFIKMIISTSAINVIYKKFLAGTN